MTAANGDSCASGPTSAPGATATLAGSALDAQPEFPKINRTTMAITSTMLVRKHSLIASLQLFVLIDLLFFPRLVFLFHIPASLLIVVFLIIANRFQLQKLQISLLFLFVSLLSVFYGATSNYNTFPEDSLKRAFQLFTILLYSFLVIDLEKIILSIVKILRVFFVYVFFMLIIFYGLPEFYFSIISTLYPEALSQASNNIENLRFMYIFSDPNSAAFMLCFCLAAYAMIEKNSKWGFLCFCLGLAAILATQSRGGYLAFIIIISYLIIFAKASLFTKLKICLLGGVVLLIVSSYFSKELAHLYSLFEARFEQEDSLGGGRLEKYVFFLNNINFLPFGVGYHLQQNGAKFLPHSDLIRLNLAYGLFALPLLLYFIIPRRRSQLLIFSVFLVPFLINTVIDDYRLFGLYLLLFRILGKHPDSVNSIQVSSVNNGLRKRSDSHLLRPFDERTQPSFATHALIAISEKSVAALKQ